MECARNLFSEAERKEANGERRALSNVAFKELLDFVMIIFGRLMRLPRKYILKTILFYA